MFTLSPEKKQLLDLADCELEKFDSMEEQLSPHKSMFSLTELFEPPDTAVIFYFLKRTLTALLCRSPKLCSYRK